METRRENYRYTLSGLPGIVLRDVEVSRCRQCGNQEVEIPRIEALHQAIALALARKPTRLTPEEIRFLRTYLDWTGVELAAHMGAAPETVSRWENGANPMNSMAERLLRLLIVTAAGQRNFSLEALAEIDEASPARPIKLVLGFHKAAWRVEAA